MQPRIIEVGGDRPAVLREQGGCLVIESDGDPVAVRVPMNEIGVLVIGARTSISGSALGSCSAFGASVVTLDRRYLPVALSLPISGHHLHAQRLALQIERRQQTSGPLWMQVVTAKLDGQARELGGNVAIDTLRCAVRPGDPENVEAQAARIYWRAMFGAEFRRDRGAEGINQLLNYGYTVLRAIVARSVCAAGFHPAIGLHHHARENAFALADDLMEPARVLVDRVVRRLLGAGRSEINKDTKRELLGAIVQTVRVGDEMRTLFDAYGRTAASLHRVLLGEDGLLWLPDP